MNALLTTTKSVANMVVLAYKATNIVEIVIYNEKTPLKMLQKEFKKLQIIKRK